MVFMEYVSSPLYTYYLYRLEYVFGYLASLPVFLFLFSPSPSLSLSLRCLLLLLTLIL